MAAYGWIKDKTGQRVAWVEASQVYTSSNKLEPIGYEEGGTIFDLDHVRVGTLDVVDDELGTDVIHQLLRKKDS